MLPVDREAQAIAKTVARRWPGDLGTHVVLRAEASAAAGDVRAFSVDVGRTSVLIRCGSSRATRRAAGERAGQASGRLSGNRSQDMATIVAMDAGRWTQSSRSILARGKHRNKV